MRLTSALCWFALGCGSTGPSLSGGLEVVAGGTIADSALARPAQAVVIRVSGGRSGVTVVFEPAPSPLGGQYTSVAPLNSLAFDGIYSDTTDSRGQIGARLWLGSKAGVGYLRIRVPSANIVDSVPYTVRAAGLFNLSADPSDTTILLGGNSTVRIITADAYGNPRSGDPYTLRSLDDVTSISGGSIRGAKLGRSTVEIATGTKIWGQVYVSVAPAVDLSGATPGGVAAVRADGANFRLVASVPGLPSSLVPTRTSWAANGSAAVFDAVAVLYWVNRAGSASRKLTDGTEAANHPALTADGSTVYYARQTAGTWRIHRVGADGANDQLVLSAPEPLTWPSPSPNGSMLVYLAADRELRLTQLATGATIVLHPNAVTPAWSPDGTTIAFICGDRPCLVNPDGTNLREASTLGGYEGGADWSPDGRWLLTRTFTTQLLELSTGVTVPLTTRLGVGGLTWAR